jgi:hypothetical protein
MPTTNADGKTVFLHLKRIQFALRAFSSALLLGSFSLVSWLWLSLVHPDYPSWAFVIIIVPFTVCFLVVVGAMFYLISRRCPNCDNAFSWNWMRSDVLKGDNSGRCVYCGIRINVSNL